MKIFVDSANLLEIEEALERGFPAGITTNPSRDTVSVCVSSTSPVTMRTSMSPGPSR